MSGEQTWDMRPQWRGEVTGVGSTYEYIWVVWCLRVEATVRFKDSGLQRFAIHRPKSVISSSVFGESDDNSLAVRKSLLLKSNHCGHSGQRCDYLAPYFVCRGPSSIKTALSDRAHSKPVEPQRSAHACPCTQCEVC